MRNVIEIMETDVDVEDGVGGGGGGGGGGGLVGGSSVPVQMVQTETARVEVVSSKMTPVTVSSNGADLMAAATQYINIHRVPAETLNKVLVSDSLSNELLTHHVDLTTATTDFGQHTVTTQYYDTDDLLGHDLTEEDRRLAAELVAVQLKHQQHQHQHHQMLTQSMTPVVPVPLTVGMDKPGIQAAIVTSYIQAVEDEVVHQHLLQEQEGGGGGDGGTANAGGGDRCSIMKIYHQPQPQPPQLQVISRPAPQQTAQMQHHQQQSQHHHHHHHQHQHHQQQQSEHQQSLPLPPLKKVLSSQSVMLRNKFPPASSSVMVQLTQTTPPHHNTAVAEEIMNRVGGRVKVEGGGDSDYEGEGDGEGEGEMRPSRRSLPHKKRIPRKLKTTPPVRGVHHHPKSYKCAKCGEGFTGQAALNAHRATTHPHLLHHHNTANAPAATKRGQPAITHHHNQMVASFSCELCNKQFTNQLRFFEHLKMHYEPPAATPELTPVITTPTTDPPDHPDHLHLHQHHQHPSPTEDDNIKNEHGQLNEEGVKEEEEQAVVSTSSSTINNNNNNVVEGVGGWTCGECGESFRRAKTLESHISAVHPRQDEIEEFSEPEDMMEGIRHVVNIPAVGDSGEEEDDEEGEGGCKQMRWRYHEVHDLAGVDLNQMCLPPSTAIPTDDNSTTGGVGNNNAAAGEEGGTIEATAAGGVGDSDMVTGGEKGGGGRGVGGIGRRKQLSCSQCNRTFNHRNSLLYHIRSHSGQRPHQCDICGKSFFSASALKVHMRLHSGDKPYKCEYCGRNFRQWGDLKYHVTSLHSNQKQFQCEYCGKDFARKYSLIVHRRIHTGEKNYRCEFCQKTFRASSYLQNHRRIHTGEKPHPCDVCGKPFRVRSDMKRHRHTHSRERPSTRQHQHQHSQQPQQQQQEGGVGGPASNSGISDQDEESGEAILPDNNSAAAGMTTPLNLNIRQVDADGLTTYSRSALDREGNTLYVWLPSHTSTATLLSSDP